MFKPPFSFCIYNIIYLSHGNLYVFGSQLEFWKHHFENYRGDGNVRSMCIKLEIHKWKHYYIWLKNPTTICHE